MIDFTSSLYLGLLHDTASLPKWSQLTTGTPAALKAAPGARTVAGSIAALVGVDAATVAPSTLHAFWDLFLAMSARTILVDDCAYPIAKWGAERARCAGATVRTFRHHDVDALRQTVSGVPHGRRPVVLTDGFCPGCGRVPPIAGYLAIVRPLGGSVVVDDTQAIGVLGTPAEGHPYGRGGGGIARWSPVPSQGVIVVASLAKGFGVPIAAVAGTNEAVHRYEARSETRVHCSPPSNAHLSAAIRALRINAERGDVLRTRLAGLVMRFRAALTRLAVPLTAGLFPIQTVRADAGLDLPGVHRRLGELGIRTVLHRPACVRGLGLSFIFTAAHREIDVDRAVRALQIALPDASRGARRPSSMLVNA